MADSAKVDEMTSDSTHFAWVRSDNRLGFFWPNNLRA